MQQQQQQQHNNKTYTYSNHAPLLGEDGLVNLRSDVQDRLWQIIEGHKRREEALQRELHTYRQALIKQVCHRCNHAAEFDKQDDTVSSLFFLKKKFVIKKLYVSTTVF